MKDLKQVAIIYIEGSDNKYDEDYNNSLKRKTPDDIDNKIDKEMSEIKEQAPGGDKEEENFQKLIKNKQKEIIQLQISHVTKKMNKMKNQQAVAS